MNLKAVLGGEDDADYPSTPAAKRSKTMTGSPNDDNSNENIFRPILRFIPFTKPNGDAMLAVIILLPSGLYNNEDDYWLELDGDVLRLCVVMPSLMENFEAIFADLIALDPQAFGYLATASRESMKQYHKNAKGAIIWTAEIDLPMTPALDEFSSTKVKSKSTLACTLAVHLTMHKYAEGTHKKNKEIECD